MSSLNQLPLMASPNDDADLSPSVASGYKITEKKTVGEYAALDAKYFPLPLAIFPLPSYMMLLVMSR